MNEIQAHTLRTVALASGICDAKMVIPQDVLHQVMAFAKAHAVDGLVAEAVLEGKAVIKEESESKGEKKAVLIKLAQLRNNQEKLWLQYDSALGELASLLERGGIDFVVFKGLVAASFYANPSSRTMGDIDFYVPEWDYGRALVLIEDRLGVDVERCDVDKHDTFDYKGIRFEMHYQMETFGSARHQKYFDCWVNNSIKEEKLGYYSTSNGVHVPVLAPEVDLVLVFKHMFNHLIGEGVGLRQVTDFAVLLNSYMEDLNLMEVRRNLINVGYLKAFDAMVALAGRYYIVKWEEYKAFLNRDDFRMADMLMADVLRNGNFGRLDYRWRHGWRKRMETTQRFFSNCWRYFRLAPWDIMCLVPKRIVISLKAH